MRATQKMRTRISGAARVVRSSRGAASVLAAAVLAVGLVLGFTVFGLFYKGARPERNTIRTTGLATEPFEADIVKWTVAISRTVPETGLQEGYARIHDDLQALIGRMTESGLAADDITPQPVTTNPVYDPSGISGYQITQSLFLISEELDTVEDLALNPADLVGPGVILQNSQLEYFYSRLTEVKHALLGRATEDARARAEEIATASGDEVGSIITADAGVFQITEPYSTEVAAYGIYNTASREKQIRVTVHAVFTLE